MGHIIIMVITVILSVVGFLEIMKTVIFKFFKNTSENTIMLIIPGFSEYENPEYSLRSTGECVRWKNCQRPTKVICITDNLTDDGNKIATLVCNDYDFMELMTTEKLYEILKENIDKKDC